MDKYTFQNTIRRAKTELVISREIDRPTLIKSNLSSYPTIYYKLFQY